MIDKQVKGNGEDVVIIHGLGCDFRHMRPIVDELVNRYRVSNINLPGNGFSDWQPTIHNIHDFANLLHPELPQKAIYIGWSFGGLVSISLSARYPQIVKRFIGIGTTPKFIAESDWHGVAQPGFQALCPEIKRKGFKAFSKDFLDAEFKDFDFKPKAYHELIQLIEKAPKRDLEVFFQGLRICDATDLRQEFKSLRCPVDLILGDQDDAVPKATFEKIKQLNPDAHLHIMRGAHHMPFWTHSLEFNKILNSILSND
jgi:pimeloyl-[acyl-carrier protein] methyl ester esterase